MPSQLMALAEVTVTVDIPVIIKSDPFAAMELHFTGSAKVIVIDEGEQGGGVTFPMAIEAC